MKPIRALIVVLLILLSTQAMAVNVRGRVDFYSYNGVFPMARANVQFCYVGGNCLNYTTGNDGMYYFNAVSAWHDIYINGVFRLRVFITNHPNFDIIALKGN